MAILTGLLVGLMIGVWQGFWVAYQKVPSFIVTLGGLIMFRGIYLVITDGITIGPLNKSFTVLAQGLFPQTLGMVLAVISAVAVTVGVIRGRASKKKYGIKPDSPASMLVKIVLSWGLILGVVWWMNRYLGIPIPVIIMAILALIFTFIAIKTEFGRNLYRDRPESGGRPVLGDQP